MEPGKTSFFQALGVPTKIARGTIEITSDLKLVEKGSKVGASEATLLNMLNISPFTYGMKIQQVYEEGQTFSPDVLDIEESQLLKALTSAINTIATISLATNYPTLPSIMHSLVNGYKKALAVAIETDYTWEGIEDLKDRIANPDAYASAAPAAAATDSAAPAAAKEEEKEEEKEESEDEGTGSYHGFAISANITQALAVSSTRFLQNSLLRIDRPQRQCDSDGVKDYADSSITSRMAMSDIISTCTLSDSQVVHLQLSWLVLPSVHPLTWHMMTTF